MELRWLGLHTRQLAYSLGQSFDSSRTSGRQQCKAVSKSPIPGGSLLARGWFPWGLTHVAGLPHKLLSVTTAQVVLIKVVLTVLLTCSVQYFLCIKSLELVDSDSWSCFFLLPPPSRNPQDSRLHRSQPSAAILIFFVQSLLLSAAVGADVCPACAYAQTSTLYPLEFMRHGLRDCLSSFIYLSCMFLKLISRKSRIFVRQWARPD